MKKNKQYFNYGQQKVMFIGAKDTTVIASRRFGKSDGLIAPHILRLISTMPGATCAIVGLTHKQLLTRTLPATLAALSRLGYKNGKHYFIGRKPPVSSGFKEPITAPVDYSQVMTWYNGTVFILISQDTSYSSNSLTLSHIIVDEARTIKYDKYTNETVPALGGFSHFPDCPWERGQFLVSDMPQSKSAMWLLEKEKLMKNELIEGIKGLVYEIYLCQEKLKYHKTKSLEREIISLKKDLVALRKVAHYYAEFNAIDNIQILGEEYIKSMKRNLPPLIFRISILNQRHFKIEDGFYSALNESHYYSAFDNEWLNNQRTNEDDFDFSKLNTKVLTCLQDADIDKSQPLAVAFDYNSNINWLVVGQAHKSEKKMLTLKSFFVKTPRKIREVIKDFCKYYAPLPRHEVVYYYDHTAKQGAYAETTNTYVDIVENEFRQKGWLVFPIFINQAPRHDIKHFWIDDALKGRNFLLPYFNKEHNEFLLPAMENTGIIRGKKGFRKNKSGEKLKDTEDNPAELRTDGTDAWDTLFIGLNFYPYYGNVGEEYGSVYV